VIFFSSVVEKVCSDGGRVPREQAESSSAPTKLEGTVPESDERASVPRSPKVASAEGVSEDDERRKRKRRHDERKEERRKEKCEKKRSHDSDNRRKHSQDKENRRHDTD